MELTVFGMVIGEDPTISQIRAVLAKAEAEVGNGRFVLTIGTEASDPNHHIIHHFRPTAYAFEDAKVVARGPSGLCLAALPTYINSFPKPYTQEQVAQTIGIEVGPFDRFATIDGIGNIHEAAAEFSAKAGPDMEPPFRQGWQDRIYGVTKNPHKTRLLHADVAHAWEQGWAAADRHVNA